MYDQQHKTMPHIEFKALTEAECNTIFSDKQLCQVTERPYRELGQFGFLMTNTEIVLETSVYSPSNHLTLLLAREYFIKFGISECLYRNGTADNSAVTERKTFLPE
jgi:hypothetical protein